jgi:hypothetical protein
MIDVCLGFDGSDWDDWTAIRAETLSGWQFTPTYGPDQRPTIWNPTEWGGKIPRLEVRAAVAELFSTLRVARMYADPPYWSTEIDEWALEYGDQRVARWATYRLVQMHSALERFVTDLGSGALTHDDCPITTQHVAHARKLAAKGSAERYYLGKPSQAQKIDAAVTSVICHEAAADARAAGWAPPPPPPRMIVMR